MTRIGGVSLHLLRSGCVLAGLALTACGDDGRANESTSGLSVGSASTGPGTGGTGEPTTGTTGVDVPTQGGQTDGVTSSGTTMGACPGQCGDLCCEADMLCFTETMTCIPDLGPCTTNDDCEDDSYCAAQGICVPYPDDGKTDLCQAQRQPGIFRVSVQCEWLGPPPGDPYPTGTEVRVKPLVADFKLDADDADIKPSIVFVGCQGDTCAVRVLDGETCKDQFLLDSHLVSGDSTPALGDLDGDGRPEIVAHAADGGAVAWTYDPGMKKFVEMWRSMDTTASGVHSLSLADLDDDAVPEVILGALVYSNTGELRSAAGGQGDGLCQGGYHAPATIADVDLDDRLEIVGGGTIWTWDDIADDLVEESYFTADAAPAFTAVADFGDFPGFKGDGPGRPEIVAMSAKAIRVQTIAGDILFGPAVLPGGGDGGNVTIADFDGDGAPEFGVVGSTLYVVYDPACGDPKFAGECASGSTDGILWQATIAENSCAIMGSTVFDFEGDGSAEVVYADECFIRVFAGTDGQVIWSHPRSSATWYEAPIVADADGDQRAELITGYSSYVGNCGGPDPIFAGLRCTAEFACPTAQLTCDADLCRCTQDADCGDPDMVCADPLPASPGTGKVCRANYSARVGLRVFSDANWVGSRPIWNQHAYSVTHVESDGTIPQGSTVPRNWEVEGLNNFRQNTQDDLGLILSPDITVEGTDYGKTCSADNPILPMEAEVCNRGLLAIDPPLEVGFYDKDPDQGGVLLCSAVTTMTLAPGQCEKVGCEWNDPPTNTAIDVFIEVDGGGAVAECFENNNLGTLHVQCPPPAPN